MLDRAATVNACNSSAAPEPMPDNAIVCAPAFSINDTPGSPASVGASFTGVTVTLKLTATESTPPFATPPLSFTFTVIRAVPLESAAGVYVKLPVSDGLVYVTAGCGINPGRSDTAVTVSVCASSAAPVPIPESATVCAPASSRTGAGSDIAASVGASFTPVTVTAKLTVTESTPPFATPPLSLTTTVTVAVPLLSTAGVNLSVPVADGLV